MTIVAMSKLLAIAPKNNRRLLLKELTQRGCVEIDSSAEHLTEEEWAEVAERFDDASDVDRRLAVLSSARELLDRYAPSKSGFLVSRRQISEQEFLNETIVKEAQAEADTINDWGRQSVACAAEAVRLAARKAALMPWQSLDISLNAHSGKYYHVLLGVSPFAGTAAQDLLDTAAAAGPAELQLISSDREQHYYCLILHAGFYDEVMDGLKAKGFSIVSFKDIEGTAAENISNLDTQLQEVEAKRLEIITHIKEAGDKKAAIEQAIDALTIESRRDQVLSGLAATNQTLYLEGWTPKSCESAVAEVLEQFGCAYQFLSPEEGEEAPVLLANNKYVEPFTMVTELYSMPTYTSGLDPNPFMAPFYFIFFGLMMADMGYGLVISFVAHYIIKKSRPDPGSIKERLMKLMLYCGISTFLWGLLFGGFFGDAVGAFSTKILGIDFALRPLLYDPLAEPMNLFILSLAFGFIQTLLGLGLNAYKMIKHGHVADAVFDAGFWMLLLLGVPLCVVNVNAGLSVMGAGALGVVLFAGRENKNPLKRIVGGLGSLYGVTGYLSDILSYSRLLALSLSGAVIAQVMNTMGSLGGRSIVGVIAFFVVFVIGHVFNVAINIIGTFVHTSRLQFIEFFGKFFDSGGKPFTPLYNKTKYVEITKEAH